MDVPAPRQELTEEQLRERVLTHARSTAELRRRLTERDDSDD